MRALTDRKGCRVVPDRCTARVKAFCVGQAKSGTASIVGLLSAHYRVAHEPERAATLDLILRHANGELSDAAIREHLRERDARLNLDYDVAWANQFLVLHLLDVFPEAKFIVLIRDCYTWLQSIMGHLTVRDVPADVVAFLRWWFMPDRYPHGVEDRALADRGLYSVAAYLHAWNRHVDSCIGSIPAERRLVLRTNELGASHRRLAGFLGIPVTSLDVGHGHRNRGIPTEPLTSIAAPAYVDEMVRSICGTNMALHFPELHSVFDLPQLRP